MLVLKTSYFANFLLAKRLILQVFAKKLREFLSLFSRSSVGKIRQSIREGNLKKEHFTGKHTKHHTLGGRAYPVRHYPIAVRLRDRKGHAILCIALNPQSGDFSGAILGVRSVALLHLIKRTFSVSEFFGRS